MNGYVGIYKSLRIIVHAETSYQAQQLMLSVVQKRYPRAKGHDITVILAEKDGEQIVHRPDF